MRKKLSFVSLILTFFLVQFSFAQEKEIEGTVEDEDGNPLPGVNITVEESNSGTQTDFQGEYSIEVETGQTLTFSFIGMQDQQKEVGESDTIDVVMQEGSELEEVVVTALGIEKEEKAVGYSTQGVDKKDLEIIEKVQEPNVLSSLTGRIAGLNIRNNTNLFEDPDVNLRGENPLIVIDGIPDREGDLWKINSNDIEDINTLKGTTASTLYGSVGKDGAIMITTKKGEKGKMRVSINNSTQLKKTFVRKPDVQTQYGTGNNGEYAYVDGSGSGSEGGGWMWGPELGQKDPNTESGYWETTQYNSPTDPETGDLIPIPWINRGENNIKNFFRTGLQQSNNVSVDWGNDDATFRMSFSNDYQKGTVPNTDLKRTSFSIAGEIDSFDDLNITTNFTYNKTYTSNFPQMDYGEHNYMYNLALWTGADIDARDLKNYWVEGKEGIQQRHFNTSYYNNPYFIAYEYEHPYNKDNLTGNVNLEYSIVPHLKAKGRVGINQYSLNREEHEPKSFVSFDENGNYTEQSGYYFDITSEIGLAYENQFSDNFKLDVEGYFSNFYKEKKHTQIGTDGLVEPGFYSITNNAASTLKFPADDNYKNYEQINSGYAFADLNFYDTFFLNLSGRYDYVSTLPQGNNGFFYPSVSGSLLIDEIVDLPDWMDMLKLRGSFAEVSNGKIGDDEYGYINAFNKVDAIWNGQNSYKFGSSLIDPNVKPEKSKSWEIGTNLVFLENRLNFDFTYFQTKDSNNLVETPLSLASGYENYLTNGNLYQRNGVEFTLNADILRGGDFEWSTQINFSHFKKTLESIYGGKERYNNLTKGDRTDLNFYGDNAEDTDYEFTPEGETVIGDDGRPVSSKSPRNTPAGHSNPDWTYGISQYFEYKDFALSVLFDGRLGGKMYSWTDAKMWWGGKAPETVNHYREEAYNGESTYISPGKKVVSGSISYNNDGSIKEDTREFEDNDVPVKYNSYMQDTYGNVETDHHYYSQTFIKLRELSLTYNVPDSFAEKMDMASASISLIGRNLLLFSKIDDVDPDSGEDELQTPSMRSFGINFNLTF